MVKLNRRITVQITGSAQNEMGGNQSVIVSSWGVWAQVENRTGSNSNPYQQQVWQYDYKITKRKEASRPTQSNYEIIYENKRLKIESISIEDENFKAYEVLRCSVIDENVIITES